MTAPESKAAPGMVDVLTAHDWLTPRGYAWPCCTCGEEFPGGEDEAFAHVAAALSDAGFGDTAAARAEAVREAARAVGHAEDCGMDPDRDPYIGCRCRMSLVWAYAARIARAESKGDGRG